MSRKYRTELIMKQIEKGYSYAKNRPTKACDFWDKAWKEVISLLNDEDFENLFEMDMELADGQICNWAQDYDTVLARAMEYDPAYARQRINFAKAYRKRIGDETEQNTLNMRWAVAETYHFLEEEEEAEREYRALTDEYPEWAWGWIGWSEMHATRTPSMKDSGYDRAIAILLKGLEREEFPFRYGVLRCLKYTYLACDRNEDAEAIVLPENWDPDEEISWYEWLNPEEVEHHQEES